LSSQEDFMVFEIDDFKVKVPIQLGDPPTTKKGEPRWVVPDYWKNSNDLLIDYADGKGYIKVVGKPKPLGTFLNRDFPIEVNEEPTVKELKGKGIIDEGWEIAPKSNPKQRFVDVVMAFNDIYNRTGKMEGMEQYDNFANIKLGTRIQQNKFIKFAKSIGLFEEQGKKRQARKIITKLEADLLAFSEQDEIQKWQEYTTLATDKDPQTMRELKKALHILDLTPAEFLKGDPKDPDMQNPLTRMFAFESWIDKMRDTPTFHGRREKDGEDDPHVWSLNEWAMAQKRPFFTGEGMSATKAGVRIASKKRAGAKAERGNQKKEFTEALKHFAVTMGVMAGGKKVGSKWELPTPTLHYNTLRMTAKEMLAVEKCLRNPTLKFAEKSLDLTYPETVTDGDVTTPHPFAGEKMDVEYETSYADWEDTLLYYLLALDVGWRANEGLTATANYLDVSEEATYSTGIYFDEKGNPDLPEGIMMIKFLTRKSWTHRDPKGKLRTSHSEMILTPETRKAVQDKVNKVEAGMKLIGKISDDKLFKTYGLKRWTINKEGNKIKNIHHSLIGHDGKYIDPATMKFPTKSKISPREKHDIEKAGGINPQLKETNDTKKLHAILRKCFVDSGVNLEEIVDGVPIGQYWLRDTTHALRHVFAQKWLMQSNWNYTHVAIKGHWASTKILEDAYGGQFEKTYILDSVKFAQVKLETVEEEMNKEVGEGLRTFAKNQKEEQKSGIKKGET